MYKLEVFDGKKTYVAPNGDLYTPEVMRLKVASIDSFKHIITTDEAGEIVYAIELFSAVKAQMGIDQSLSDSQAILAMEDILNTKPVIDTTPTAQDRIAAALEYQNLLSM